MSKKCLIAAAIAIWVASTPAAGGIINAKLLSVNPSQVIRIHDGSTSPPLDVYTRAGIFNLRILPGTTDLSLGSIGDKFTALCIDLGNPISVGGHYMYNSVDPTSAPNPHVYSDGLISDAELLALQKLLGAFPMSWVTTGQEAAALQAAVWEIVNEAGNVYDVTAGDFIGGGALDTNLANHMLTVSAGYTGPLPELMALTNPCAQDLLVIIPEPATFTMLVMGMGVLAVRWTRRRR